MAATYDVVVSESSAAAFHARPPPEPAQPAIWHHRITGPALVVGSTQSPSIVDAVACRAAGVDVVRRRSGGGAVLLVPGDVTWIDVIVPRGAPGWTDDVHATMVWLGERLAGAFVAAGGVPTAVHRGPLVATPWSSLICFDGVGAGELVTDRGKLVGLSQRRTRSWARLQCCWYRRHDHADLVGLLAPDVRPDVSHLSPVATAAVEATTVLDRLRASLDT